MKTKDLEHNIHGFMQPGSRHIHRVDVSMVNSRHLASCVCELRSRHCTMEASELYIQRDRDQHVAQIQQVDEAEPS